MIFIDSNVPMYLVGADHQNKYRLLEVLEPLIRGGERMITSVEVFQEILHRYTAINRRDAIGPAMDSLQRLADEVLSFSMPEIHRARTLINTVQNLSARDALHVAVMQGAGVTRILSFDGGFDLCPGIERVH